MRQEIKGYAFFSAVPESVSWWEGGGSSRRRGIAGQMIIKC